MVKPRKSSRKAQEKEVRDDARRARITREFSRGGNPETANVAYGKAHLILSGVEYGNERGLSLLRGDEGGENLVDDLYICFGRYMMGVKGRKYAENLNIRLGMTDADLEKVTPHLTGDELRAMSRMFSERATISPLSPSRILGKTKDGLVAYVGGGLLVADTPENVREDIRYVAGECGKDDEHASYLLKRLDELVAGSVTDSDL